jgi:hypothetical protein
MINAMSFLSVVIIFIMPFSYHIQSQAAPAVCPFTGETMNDPELLNLRPLGLSISMNPPKLTRPPTGINSAPFVFETFIGEGMTRLFAIFYCEYPETTPYRSDYQPNPDSLPGIGNFVWHDANKNGLQDQDERGVFNVTINLYTEEQRKIESTTTDAAGFFTFENIQPGNYYLTFIIPEEANFTLADAGPDTQDSDPDSTGQTEVFTITESSGYVDSIDAGLVGEGVFTGERIEGMRSGRKIYIDIAKHFGAGIIYLGADPVIEAAISFLKCASGNSRNDNDIGAGGISISRLKDLAASCQSELGNPDLDVYKFGPPSEGGQAAPELLVFYNSLNQTKWMWNDSHNGYVRYQNDPDKPDDFTLSVDRLTGEPVVRQNVIVMKAAHEVENQAGTIINLDVDHTQGNAILFRNGAAFPVCWSTLNSVYENKSNRERPIVFTDCSGNILNLAKGKTWVNVMDISAEIWETGGGKWKARFYSPIYAP